MCVFFKRWIFAVLNVLGQVVDSMGRKGCLNNSIVCI